MLMLMTVNIVTEPVMIPAAGAADWQYTFWLITSGHQLDLRGWDLDLASFPRRQWAKTASWHIASSEDYPCESQRTFLLLPVQEDFPEPQIA